MCRLCEHLGTARVPWTLQESSGIEGEFSCFSDVRIVCMPA